MSRKRWIGIFGGSFNPPHLGHLLASVYALKVFELDEIWLVPAYRHAFQKDLLPFELRFEACQRLVSGLGPRLKVSTIEREIGSDGKMLNTLLALRKRHKNDLFSLVIGSDILEETKKWYRFEEIERRFMVLVVPRGARGKSEIAIPDISSTTVRRRLKKNDPVDDLLTPEVAAMLTDEVLDRSTLPQLPVRRDKKRRPGRG